MRMALCEAEAAYAEGEVPVGAIVLHENRVIAAAHNQREQLHDPTGPFLHPDRRLLARHHIPVPH